MPRSKDKDFEIKAPAGYGSRLSAEHVLLSSAEISDSLCSDNRVQKGLLYCECVAKDFLYQCYAAIVLSELHIVVGTHAPDPASNSPATAKDCLN